MSPATGSAWGSDLLRLRSAWLLLAVVTTPAVATTDDTDASVQDTDAAAQSDLVPAPVHAPGSGPVPLGATPQALLDEARRVRNQPLPDRMKAISDLMMGRPYLADPLGEGRGVDADPFARYDVYDCLTFLEEVLALAEAGDPAHAASTRLGLRYGQQSPPYAHRRHFMELQWIPGNIEDGWLVDTTAEYGPVTHMEREVTLDTWNSWAARKGFAHTDDELPIGTMKLDVLSLDDAIAAADRIRPGTIVLTVRVDRPWKPIWISHVGFVLPNDDGDQADGNKPMVRHATRMADKKVRDHGLAWYFEHLKSYSKWPAAGIALLEPVEQGPRISRLP